MENLMKQMREKFTAESDGSRDKKIPIERAQSSKEKKKAQNWLQRQFVRKTSGDYESRESEHATAVAAAAYAIIKQEDVSEIPQHKTSELSKTKSKVDGTPKSPILKPLSGSLKITDDGKKPEKRKTSSFKELFTATKSDFSTTTTAPEIAPPPPPIPKPQAKAVAGGEAEADAWEKAEQEKIKQKYDKLRETIDSWETKKKKKAKRVLDSREGELEERRVKAMERFQSEMRYILRIAGGARVQADERRRNEELQAKEKADRIRTTGRTPVDCSCF